MGDDGQCGENRLPRSANTLPGLLQYVAGVDPEALSSTTAQPMDSERRTFLAEAIQSLTSDHVVRLQQLMDTLNSNESSPEEKEQALDDLTEWCDDIDFAIDFFKIGGVDSLIRFVDSPRVGLRWRTLELMATILQNNSWAQNQARSKGWLSVFIRSLEEPDAPEAVRVKALYAISCAVRDNDENRKEFITRLRGLEVLLRGSQSDVEKLQLKSVFLIKSLAASDPAVCDELRRMGMIEQLVGLAFRRRDQVETTNFVLEHVFSTLLLFAERDSDCREECGRSDLQLKRTLQRRLELLRDKEQHREERNYARTLIDLVFGIDASEDCDITER